MKTLFALTLVALVASPAFAQEEQPVITEEIRWTLAVVQVKASLESETDAVKAQTLKNAIVMATLYRDKADLSRAVGAIRKVHESSKNASHQRLALAALQVIDTIRARDYVQRNTTPEQFDEGRMIVASVLNDYYLSQTTSSEATS